MDRNLLVECCLKTKISSMKSPMKIKDTENIAYKASGFTIIEIFLPRDQNIVANIRRELYNIEN